MSSKSAVKACVLAVAGVLAVQAAQATVVYREVFPNDFAATQGLEATAQGWFGAQHGVEEFTPSSGQITKPASGNGEPGPINSNPQGAIDDTGFLFWSPANRAGIYLYTNEIAALNLDSSAITTVSWDSRNSSDNLNTGTRMRVAVRIGGDWYISDGAEPHSSGSGAAATWETNSMTLASQTFALFDDHNSGESLTSLPRNNDGDSGRALPGGAVEAIGLWINFNQTLAGGPNPTIRIDNFTVEAAVPAPVTALLFGTALLGLAAARRRSA
jgi:hypothetical protein